MLNEVTSHNEKRHGFNFIWQPLLAIIYRALALFVLEHTAVSKINARINKNIIKKTTAKFVVAQRQIKFILKNTPRLAAGYFYS